jgi:AcrR family transcriptional regulator
MKTKTAAAKEELVEDNRPKDGCPKEDRRAVRHRAIIEAAARLFAEKGYNDCEMDSVAAEVGVAKGTLYLYFPGKQELFFACVDLGMSQMQCAVRQAAEATDDPLERMRRGIRAYLAFFDENPHYVELQIQERAIFRDSKRSIYFEHRDANRAPWRELYTRMVGEGRFRSDIPVEGMLDTVSGLLYGTMFTNRFVGRKTTIDEQTTALIEIILHGVLASPNDRCSQK